MAFWNSRKPVEVRKTMGRLLNSSFSMKDAYPEAADVNETRVETRTKRLLPVAVFLNGRADDSIFIGFTRDLSLEGMGLVTTLLIPTGELFVVVGDPKERFILQCQCVHSKRIGFGCFESGLCVTEVLRGAKYAPLLEYVEYLETPKCEQSVPSA